MLMFAGGPPSHILWNIKWPYFFIMLICFYEQLVRNIDPAGVLLRDPSGVIAQVYRCRSKIGKMN